MGDYWHISSLACLLPTTSSDVAGQPARAEEYFLSHACLTSHGPLPPFSLPSEIMPQSRLARQCFRWHRLHACLFFFAAASSLPPSLLLARSPPPACLPPPKHACPSHSLLSLVCHTGRLHQEFTGSTVR